MKTLITLLLCFPLLGCSTYTIQRVHRPVKLTVATAKAEIDAAYVMGEIDGKALEDAWAAVARYEATKRVEEMEVLNWRHGPTNALPQAVINREWAKGAAISEMIHLLSVDRCAKLKGL